MSPDPTKSLSYLLGELVTDVKYLRAAEEARQETDQLLIDRVTSLEQFKFKLITIVATVGALFGFIFSHLKDGAEWLTDKLT